MSFSSIDGGGVYAAPKPKPPEASPTITQTYGSNPGTLPNPFPTTPSVTFTSPDTIGVYSTPDFVTNNAPKSSQQAILDKLSSGGGNVYSSTPSYAPQTPTIDVNSLLQKALANMGFSNIDSSLQKAREQLITKFGDANLATLAGFGLDPQAGAFAQQNYLSGNADLARLDKSRDLSKKAVIDRLASHGILFSGDLGYGLNKAESQYGNQRYDLTQSYLQQLQSLLDNSLQQKQALRSNVVNALLSAYGNQIQDPEQLIGLYGG